MAQGRGASFNDASAASAAFAAEGGKLLHSLLEMLGGCLLGWHESLQLDAAVGRREAEAKAAAEEERRAAREAAAQAKAAAEEERRARLAQL